MNELNTEPNDWIVTVWSMVGNDYCATQLYSPSTSRVKVWNGKTAKYEDSL